jgi:hypothetical protein
MISMLMIMMILIMTIIKKRLIVANRADLDEEEALIPL